MNIEKKYANEIKDSLNPKTTFEDLNLPILTKKTVKQKTFKKFVPYVCGLVACSIAGAIIIPNALRDNEKGETPVIDKSSDEFEKKLSEYNFDRLIEKRGDFERSIPYTNYLISKSTSTKLSAPLRSPENYFKDFSDDETIFTNSYDFSKEINLIGYVIITEVNDRKACGQYMCSGIKVNDIPDLPYDVKVNDIFYVCLTGLFNNNLDDPILYLTMSQKVTEVDYFEDLGYRFEDYDDLNNLFEKINKYSYVNIAGNAKITNINGLLLSGVFEKSGIRFENVEIEVDDLDDEINVNDYLYIEMLGKLPNHTSLKLENAMIYNCVNTKADTYKFVSQEIEDSEFLNDYMFLNLDKAFCIKGYAKVTKEENGLLSGTFYDSGLTFEDVPYNSDSEEITENMYFELNAFFDGNLENKKLTNCYIYYARNFYESTYVGDIETRTYETLSICKNKDESYFFKNVYFTITSSNIDLENNTFSAVSNVIDGSKIVIENSTFSLRDAYDEIDFIDSFEKNNIDNFMIVCDCKVKYENVQGVDTYYIVDISKSAFVSYPVELLKTKEEIYNTTEIYGNPYPNDILSWSETFADTKGNIAYLIADMNSFYEIYKTAYFKVDIDGRDPIISTIFGEGIAECIYVESNVGETMFSIIKDGKMFSCCDFSMHKVIRGYYLYKDFSFMHSIYVHIDSLNEKITSCGFGKIDKYSICFNDINKQYTWDEFLQIQNDLSSVL